MAPSTRNRRIIPLHLRKRTTVACDECRQRKIKCDGGFPCSKCLSLNKACSISKRDGPINPMDYKESYTNLKKYNCKLERIIQSLFPDVSLETLRNNTDEFEKEVCINKTKLPIVVDNSNNNNIKNEIEDQANLQVEKLNNFSQIFVSTTDQSFIDFIARKPNDTVTSNTSSTPLLMRTSFSHNNKEYIRRTLLTLIKDGLETLPESDDQVRKLVDIFLHICETNYFYVHHARFHAQIEEMLVRRHKNDLEYFVKHWSTLVLLLAMIAISAGFEYMTDDGIKSIKELDEWLLDTSPGLKYYYAALQFAGFLIDQKSIESIQGLLLFGVFMTTNRLETFQMFDGGYIFMNLATEIAIANKLHLKQPFMECSEEDREVYKRLWWSCYTMERRFGVNLGKREIIDPGDITVDMPVDIPALKNRFGYSNCMSQHSMIQLNFIFRDIAELFYTKTRKNKLASVSIDPAAIKKLVEEVEKCKMNFPEYTEIENLDPKSAQFRAHVHLNLTYYLAKIYIGKPFLLYKVENYKRLAENGGDYESAFVDHLSSICIDAAFCSIELLSELDKHNKLGLFSCTDINFCNIALFTILVFLRIDGRSETTLLFLRKGLKILKTMSRGCSSAKLSLNKLKKLDNLVSDITELDEMEKDINIYNVFGIETAAKSFPTDTNNEGSLLEFGKERKAESGSQLGTYMTLEQDLLDGILDFWSAVVDGDIYEQLNLLDLINS